MLLPAIAQKRAADAGGKFRPQGQAVAAPILETVHFLRHHVGGLAERAGEDRSRFKHRHLDALEAIEPPHALERLHHMPKAFLLFAKYVLRAAHRLGCLYLCHGQPLAREAAKRKWLISTKPLDECSKIPHSRALITIGVFFTCVWLAYWVWP